MLCSYFEERKWQTWFPGMTGFLLQFKLLSCFFKIKDWQSQENWKGKGMISFQPVGKVNTHGLKYLPEYTSKWHMLWSFEISSDLLSSFLFAVGWNMTSPSGLLQRETALSRKMVLSTNLKQDLSSLSRKVKKCYHKSDPSLTLSK